MDTKQLHELMQTINRELDQGNLVRLVNNWDVPNGLTIVQRIRPADSTSNAVQTIEQIAALPHVLLYPGYLHLCKPGTPARVIAIEDCGTLENLARKYCGSMKFTHTFDRTFQ